MMLVLSLINPELNVRNSLRECCISDAGSSGSNANAFPISANILASTASVLRAHLELVQTEAPAKDSPSPMVDVRPGHVQARRGKPLLLHKQSVPLPSLRKTWKVP
jgi:hypothetical protein